MYSSLLCQPRSHSSMILLPVPTPSSIVDVSGHFGLCRAKTGTCALSWYFPAAISLLAVLADQALDDLSALYPGGHVDGLAGLVQRWSLSRDWCGRCSL